MIPVRLEPTIPAVVPSVAEHFFLSRSAPMACLRRVCWVDFDCCSSSLFRFDQQQDKEQRPRSIVYAFGQSPVRHPFDIQRFNRDEAESVDDFPRFLMGEISSPVGNSRVNFPHHAFALPSFDRASWRNTKLPLRPGQCFFFSAEKSRIFNPLVVGEVGETLESYINADALCRWRKNHRVAFDAEAGIPALGFASDGQRFHLAFKVAVQPDFELADLRQTQFVTGETESCLRKSKALVPVDSFEAWVATAFLRINGFRLQFYDLKAYAFLIGLYETNEFRFNRLVEWLSRHATQIG